MSEPAFRPRLLIVESDDDVRRVLARTLQQRFEVVPIAKGATALGRLAEERFDIVLVDLGVSDVPALDLVKAALAKDAGVPVVVTGTAIVPEGALACVAKPYDTVALDRALARAVSVAKARRAV